MENVLVPRLIYVCLVQGKRLIVIGQDRGEHGV